MQTTIGKFSGAWRADSTVKLWDKYELSISTRKGLRGLGSYCSVYTVEDGYRTHMLYQDYSKCWQSTPGARCTEKNITTLHNATLVDIKAIVFDLLVHYEKEQVYVASDQSPYLLVPAA